MTLIPAGRESQRRVSAPPDRIASRPSVQAKLEVGALDHPLERRADEVADQIMRGPAPAGAPASGVGGGSVDDGSVTVETLPCVRHVLDTPGAPLDGATRAFMEPRFGHDFSHVRVHADAAAARSAAEVRAFAFAIGHQIAFAAGRYAPAEPAGRRLLAHELAHVVQQASGGVTLRREPAPDAGVPTDAGGPTDAGVPPAVSPAPGSSVTSHVMAALDKPSPIAGFGDPAEVFRLLSGLSMESLLGTLDEVDRVERLDLTRDNLGGAGPDRDRIEAGILTVQYRNHGSLSVGGVARAGRLIAALDGGTQAAMRRFAGEHVVRVLQGESYESQNNFVLQTADDDFVLSFELRPGPSADSGLIDVLLAPRRISEANQSQMRYYDVRGVPVDDPMGATTWVNASVPAVPFTQQLPLFQRAGFNPVLLTQTIGASTAMWTFDWNGDKRPDYAVEIKFGRTNIMRTYDISTSQNPKPAHLDYHFIQPDAWKYGYQGNYVPPRAKDDLDFWKSAIEIAVTSIPVVGEVVLIAQAITGRNLFGERISTAERALDGIAALLPVAGGLIAKVAAREGGAALKAVASQLGKSENEVYAILKSVDKQAPEAAAIARWQKAVASGTKLTADEAEQLISLLRQIDLDTRGFLGAAQAPKLEWRPNAGGTVRSIDEAIELARAAGVKIPKDIRLAAVSGKWPKGRFAEYLQLGSKADRDAFLTWEQFLNRFGQIPVRLNPAILSSDEAIVAVIGHEMHELNSLRELFDQAGGQMRQGRLADLIREGVPGNLHDQAWDKADELVLKMRQGGER